MRGDFSRDSFEPSRSFSRVMMQQGRVQVDADWNEQTSLTLDYMRTLARDLLGRGAGPAGNCGFQVMTEATLPPPPASGDDPFTADERKALKNGDLLLMPGRYYVGGLAINLDGKRLYGDQVGYPFDEATEFKKLKSSGVDWIAYLDVWEEFVSADQDESIRELALGGIDTCGRGLVCWQVRILPNPASGIKDFETFASREPGKLSARTKPGEAPDSPCIIPPDARYRGVENQLYRVEIHQGSDASGKGATFKWSRDNGSVTYPLKDIDDTLIKLMHLGRDERSALASKNWVELVDDHWTGRDPAGPLAKVEEVKSDERIATVAWAEPTPELPMRDTLFNGLHPLLRRWDHEGDIKANGGALAVEAGKDIELENGIFIQFKSAAPYRAGDYWLIPARVASNDILWPGEPSKPWHLPPHGPEHFYAPLAFFKGGTLKDQRRKFDTIDKPA